MNMYQNAKLLEKCLDRLDRGESLQEILKSYPDQADQLRPLLGIAMVGRALPRPMPSRAAARVGKIMLLVEIEKLRRAKLLNNGKISPKLSQLLDKLSRGVAKVFQLRNITRLKPVFRFAVVGVVLFVASSFLTVNASASSLPGDPLYSLKLGMEQTRLFLTFDEDAKSELASIFEGRRLSEVEALTTGGRSERVRFHGTLESVQESVRVVSGVNVFVNPETKEDENLEEGNEVEVTGLTQDDGSVMALKISLDDDDLPKGKGPDKETGPDPDKVTGQDKDKETGQDKDKETGQDKNKGQGNTKPKDK